MYTCIYVPICIYMRLYIYIRVYTYDYIYIYAYQNGPSRELFDRWCEVRHNLTVITGYCVQHTLAKELLDTEPATHTLQVCVCVCA